MAFYDRQIQHLLRRAGFGATPAEVEHYAGIGFHRAIDELIEFHRVPDDVDSKIGTPGYVGVTTRGQFSPSTVINDARQRWIFRMVHSRRPLQEKMTLFWHNHFATAYSKIAGLFGGIEGTQMLAQNASEYPTRSRGQMELLRDYALGNFRDLLVEIAKDPAMLVWLDGRTNMRQRPQENFAREIMELFTMGVGFYTEADVYAGARVFTGWNMRRLGERQDPVGYYEFVYNAGQHETTAKEFSFPIYANGSRTIPARAAGQGMQDGLDLIDALARHPETGRRLARKLYAFFINELDGPDERLINQLAAVYRQNNYEMAPVMRVLLLSPQFNDPENYFARYSWPAEFVARALKEVGYAGFSVDSAITPLLNMGQQLFEPPDVNGWELGRGWFSTAGMLARMNFAATLALNQRFNIGREATPYGQTPESLLSFYLDKLSPADFERPAYENLLDYLRMGTGSAWTGSTAQLNVKASGLVHLIAGSSEYQLV